MIRFSKDGTKVKVRVDHGLSEDTHLVLNWECGSTLYSELLSSHLQKQLEKIVQQVRQEEYNRGWKDAKAKKAKCDYFYVKLGKAHD